MGYKDKEKQREANKKYYADNKEKERERHMAYRRNNPDKVKETKRKCRKKNKEKVDAYIKEYRKKNKDKIRKRWQAYRKKRMASDPSYRLAHASAVRVRSALQRQSISKSRCTIDLIGCSWLELKTHIEKQFCQGMSWENWGQGEGMWELDHIKPCAIFDLTDPIQLKECFHWSNQQPLWWEDNNAKRDCPNWAKDPEKYKPIIPAASIGIHCKGGF